MLKKTLVACSLPGNVCGGGSGCLSQPSHYMSIPHVLFGGKGAGVLAQPCDRYLPLTKRRPLRHRSRRGRRHRGERCRYATIGPLHQAHHEVVALLLSSCFHRRCRPLLGLSRFPSKNINILKLIVKKSLNKDYGDKYVC